MFKLVKILNSGVNVGEPCHIPADEDSSYYAGTLVKISAGVATNVSATDKPTHLVGENLEFGSKSRILCYPISPDMIFETTFSAAPTGIKNGSKVTLSFTSAAASSVTATTTSGVAEIYDMAGAKEAGDKVYVRFPG